MQWMQVQFAGVHSSLSRPHLQAWREQRASESLATGAGAHGPCPAPPAAWSPGKFSAERDMSSRHELAGRLGLGVRARDLSARPRWGAACERALGAGPAGRASDLRTGRTIGTKRRTLPTRHTSCANRACLAARVCDWSSQRVHKREQGISPAPLSERLLPSNAPRARTTFRDRQ